MKEPLRITRGGIQLGPSAEQELFSSIRNEGIIIVGPLLVKLKGQLAGFAFHDDGDIERGRWYRPTEESTRANIRNAFVRGTIAYSPQTETLWTRDRYVSDPNFYPSIPEDQVLAMAKSAAEVLQTSGRTTTKDQRRGYRLANYQNYYMIRS